MNWGFVNRLLGQLLQKTLDNLNDMSLSGRCVPNVSIHPYNETSKLCEPPQTAEVYYVGHCVNPYNEIDGVCTDTTYVDLFTVPCPSAPADPLAALKARLMGELREAVDDEGFRMVDKAKDDRWGIAIKDPPKNPQGQFKSGVVEVRAYDILTGPNATLARAGEVISQFRLYQLFAPTVTKAVEVGGLVVVYSAPSGIFQEVTGTYQVYRQRQEPRGEHRVINRWVEVSASEAEGALGQMRKKLTADAAKAKERGDVEFVLGQVKKKAVRFNQTHGAWDVKEHQAGDQKVLVAKYYATIDVNPTNNRYIGCLLQRGLMDRITKATIFAFEQRINNPSFARPEGQRNIDTYIRGYTAGC